jgi:hypothetical protein
MASIVEYLSAWWWNSPDPNLEVNVPLAPPLRHDETDEKKNKTKSLISIEDLISIKLKPVKNYIPAPARNMPAMNKYKLCMMNKAQLQEILRTRLKHVPKRQKKKSFIPRHPVLKELLSKTESRR